MNASSIEHRLVNDNSYGVYGLHTIDGQQSTKRVHREMQDNMNDRALRPCTQRTHGPPPPPDNPVPSLHRVPKRQENKAGHPRLDDTAT